MNRIIAAAILALAIVACTTTTQTTWQASPLQAPSPTAQPSPTDWVIPVPTWTPMPTPGPTPTPMTIFNSWEMSYYGNGTLDGEPGYVTHVLGDINLLWGPGEPLTINARVPWSARIQRVIRFAPGTYQLSATATDTVTVSINGSVLFVAGPDGASIEWGVVNGGDHLVGLDYQQITAGPVSRLSFRIASP